MVSYRYLKGKILSVTEEEIIQGLHSGDEKHFRDVVGRFHKSTIALCMGILHNREDAEDIAQDVFVEVFRSIGHFRGDSRLSTWIYRIAVNKSLNHVRKMKRGRWILPMEKLFTGGGASGEMDAGVELPPEDMERAQLSEKIHAAVDALPENQKTAFGNPPESFCLSSEIQKGGVHAGADRGYGLLQCYLKPHYRDQKVGASGIRGIRDQGIKPRYPSV